MPAALPPISENSKSPLAEGGDSRFSAISHLGFTPSPTPVAPVQIKSARWHHDRIIDFILSTELPPSQNEIAKFMGFTPTWVSIMVNSDAFKNRLEERKAELIDPRIAASINERLDGLAMSALAKLADRLDAPQPVKTMELVAIAKLAIGDKNTRPSGSGPVQNNYVFQIPPVSSNSKEWLASCQGNRSKPVELLQEVIEND